MTTSIESIGDILRDSILGSVFTFGNCTFCESTELTYTDPETRCHYCLPCLVIAVNAEGQLEEPEDPELTAYARDYIRKSRLTAQAA